ncbi:MAG: lipocalin family protein [Nitrospirota bacterium]
MMKQMGAFLLAVLSCVCLLSCGTRTASTLKVVSHIDLQRYTGVWYEIARYPNSFQEGCVASTATYTLRKDGRIDVLNQCRKHTLDGPVVYAKGKATVVDQKTNAKLKVTFFWPFYGPYWIIDIGHDYEYAVVGHPERKYLWILSRTPRMDESLYRGILERLKLQEYDVGRLLKTIQATR